MRELLSYHTFCNDALTIASQLHFTFICIRCWIQLKILCMKCHNHPLARSIRFVALSLFVPPVECFPSICHGILEVLAVYTYNSNNDEHNECEMPEKVVMKLGNIACHYDDEHNRTGGFTFYNKFIWIERSKRKLRIVFDERSQTNFRQIWF